MSSSVKAVTFDAYGTLIENRGVVTVAARMVDDHRLPCSADEFCALWVDGYYEATQLTPFRTLREIHTQILPGVLRRFDVTCDVGGYVDLFFEATTSIELYPETMSVLRALRHVRSAIVSNADHEHFAAWSSVFPVEFVLISEEVRAYKPHRLLFERAVERFGVAPHEVLHVGDSDVDDIIGAKSAGLQAAWVNRDGRKRRSDVPPPDFEMADLTGLPLLLS